MSPVPAYASAAFAVLRRDFLTFLSYRMRPITALLNALFTVTLFYYISRLVRIGAFASSDEYYAFVIVGIVILQVLTSTMLFPPDIVRQELVAGTFERLLLSPFGAVRSVISVMLFPFFYALLMALMTISISSVLYGLPVQWSTAPLAIPVGFLGALAFMPFGLLLLAAILVVKQTTFGVNWIIAAISLVAGLYFPVSLLPDWIEWASHVQPFTPAVDLLRDVLVGTPLRDPLWLGLAKLVGFAAVLLPVSLYALSSAVRLSRRRGTIIEY
jgi:ABC-2 type transport system permease protein